MNRFIFAVAALTLACGGGSSALNPAFGKTWVGINQVTIPGFSSWSYPSQVTVTVDGGTATATNICPTGGGSILFTGSGISASWNGSTACTPTSQNDPNCLLTFTYKAASATLSVDAKALSSVGTGTVTGCGLDATGFTFDFAGS